MTPRAINLIVIHCSASPNGRVTTAQDIDAWHAERGFHRADEFRRRQNPELGAIGYHFAIYTNGAVATGRHLDEVGAHAHGVNQKSIGVCLVGTDKFSAAQWESLRANITGLQKLYPQATVRGHRDLPNVHKTCPNFDVAGWLAGGMAPPAGSLLEDTA